MSLVSFFFLAPFFSTPSYVFIDLLPILCGSFQASVTNTLWNRRDTPYVRKRLVGSPFTLAFIKIFVSFDFKPRQTRLLQVNPFLLINGMCDLYLNGSYRFIVAVEDNIRLSGFNEALNFHAIPISKP